jgi:hypothetical protein
MTLHFSHMGLTDGLTFIISSTSEFRPARLWRPLGPPLPRWGAPRSETARYERNGEW